MGVSGIWQGVANGSKTEEEAFFTDLFERGLEENRSSSEFRKIMLSASFYLDVSSCPKLQFLKGRSLKFANDTKLVEMLEGEVDEEVAAEYKDEFGLHYRDDDLSISCSMNKV